MGRITVVHTADLHLGSSIKGVSPQIGSVRRKDLMQTLTKISESCRDQQTDLLLITGDLWNQRNITRPLVDFVADQFQRIPATTVVIAPGKSDTIDNGSFYREYPWSENVHIFHQVELSSIWIPYLNTCIFGRAWSPEEVVPDWSQVSQGPEGSNIIIAAYGDPKSLAIPQGILDMENLAYIALGGAHRHVTWTGKMMDPGCPEPLGFDDQGGFGILQGSVGTASGSLEFVKCNSRQFYKLRLSTEGCASEEDVVRLIEEATETMEPNKNLFQIALHGERSWDLQRLEELLFTMFYVIFTASTATAYDLDVLEAEHNKGVVGKYISTIKQSTWDEEISRRALSLGLDALLAGKVAPW